MILAQKIKPEYTDCPRVVNAVKANKRQKTTGIKLLVCLFSLLCFTVGLGFTSLTAQVAAKGQEINQTKQSIAALQTSNEKLLLKKQQLMSLDRVEQLALTELEMEKPQFENLHMVDLQDLEKANFLREDTVAEAEAAEDLSLFRTIITVVSNGISGWAIKAEAGAQSRASGEHLAISF